jgi:hypothetical protein
MAFANIIFSYRRNLGRSSIGCPLKCKTCKTTKAIESFSQNFIAAGRIVMECSGVRGEIQASASRLNPFGTGLGTG